MGICSQSASNRSRQWAWRTASFKPPDTASANSSAQAHSACTQALSVNITTVNQGSGKFNYLRLTPPEIKRHKAPTVSLPQAVNIYKTLLAHQTAKGFGKPDDYVFFPEEKNRLRCLNTIGWLFNWIMNMLGIKAGPHGADRSFYSLRHTAITFRLIFGGNIDLLTLARNARTSVEMSEKFYASTLSAEMNISLLHSKRRS